MIKLKTILQSNILYIILFIFILSYILITTQFIKYKSVYTNDTEIIGQIININYSNDKISFILKGKEKIICNYYLKNQKEINFSNLLGKKVKVIGKLKELSNNTIPNTFNYKEYLYNNKIYNSFIVNYIEIINHENIFYKLKNYILQKANNHNDRVKTYLNLFVFGEKSDLNDNIYDIYRINGIWHLFAVSGTHISLIIVTLDKILKKIKLKNIIISLCLFYFMFLTNFSASIMRATIFYYLKCILDFFNIKIESKKILFLTAFIILLLNPFAFYNVGFRYSFIISYAIMHESDKITGNYFMKILKISLISFFASIPITVNMNYEINILSILLNVIYVPFITFIVFPISISTFIIPFLSNIFDFLITILEISNQFFYKINMNILIPKMPTVLVIFYYLFLYFFSKNNAKKYLLLLGLVILINQVYLRLDKNYYLYFLDVGQGDSTLFLSPYKKEIILIDTGGIFNSSYQVSNNTIIFLKSLGISKLDYLVLTHGDFDHMGEAINLVNNFKVEKVIFNCGEFNELEQELIKVLVEKKILYYSCIKELNVDDNELYFLNNKDYGIENDNSSVIYTKLNNHKFLFMGDAGVEVEKYILEKYNLKNIDVLKVGHHGSKTSSSKSFIDKIEPKYSIISVGKNNRYGHPNDSVLDNLMNSKIYRTDKDGSIKFKIKKNKLEIETCES